MSRLVTVSNRVPLPEGATTPSGIAVRVPGALRACGALWFGWNGETYRTRDTAPAADRVTAPSTVDGPVARA